MSVRVKRGTIFPTVAGRRDDSFKVPPTLDLSNSPLGLELMAQVNSTNYKVWPTVQISPQPVGGTPAALKALLPAHGALPTSTVIAFSGHELLFEAAKDLLAIQSREIIYALSALRIDENKSDENGAMPYNALDILHGFMNEFSDETLDQIVEKISPFKPNANQLIQSIETVRDFRHTLFKRFNAFAYQPRQLAFMTPEYASILPESLSAFANCPDSFGQFLSTFAALRTMKITMELNPGYIPF